MANAQRATRCSGTTAFALALLAGVAGCSDDFARLGSGVTTASLGLEASNQDRIIRKAGTDQASRPGVKPVGVGDQAFPGRPLAIAAVDTDAPATSYAAPAVASNALPRLMPSKPQAVATTVAAPVLAEKIAPTVKASVRRTVTQPKLAATGIPVVPPAPAAPGRLRELGEDLTVASIEPATKAYAPPVRQAREVDAPGGGYTVVSGDTIYGIARRYGVTSQQMLDANGMTGAALRIGQRLAIPGSDAALKPIASPPAAKPVKVAKKDEVVTGSVPKSSSAPVAAKPVQAPKAAAVQKAVAPGFAWPARGRVIATYGQRTPGGTNKGVDIALPLGSPVKATAGGIVLYSGSELKDFGNLVLVRHDDGWVSAYANASQNLVKRGDRVSRGQTIAKSGKSGNATEPQLHFELRRNSKPVDPQRHLGS